MKGSGTMAVLLGIDTGGTYTDAVLLDEETDLLVARAKALTTRPDLSVGIGHAIEKVLEASDASPQSIAMVSMSTTLATNALVEGFGGRVGLILIGFEEEEIARAGLRDAVGTDPVIFATGGHTHSGAQALPLDENSISGGLETFSGVTGVAIASKFSTRNPEHEQRTREIVREALSVPVTCSHELSKALGGPKRAVTAVLNARLVGLIDRLIVATEAHLAARNIQARLMVVRGDGALISAEQARERPIETILSGPAASVAGAQWLTGLQDAMVSDIGGTTTDICLLRGGLPKIDPKGAKVGPFRTMVEAVAMRTFGLGGDSEVHPETGLEGGVRLGPQRVIPVSLFAKQYPEIAQKALDHAMSLAIPPEDSAKFVLALSEEIPDGLDPRETALLARLSEGPLPVLELLTSRLEVPALERLITRGLAARAGVTPSDASHVLGTLDAWDGIAAEKAIALLSKRRTGNGQPLASGPLEMANLIIDQLTNQSVSALLETAFAEEGWDAPDQLAEHPLLISGLSGHRDILNIKAGLALPIIGLGASARSYYPAIGERLGCDVNLPMDGGVANAIGAVVGQVTHHAEGTVTSGGEGAYLVHVAEGPQRYDSKTAAFEALRTALTANVKADAKAAGVDDMRLSENLDVREANVEARAMFIEAKMRITVRGRPRIAE